MSSLDTEIYITQFLGVLPVAATFAYLYQSKRRRYIEFWAGAWMLVAVQSLAFVVGTWSRHALYQAAGQWSLVISAVLFFLGVQSYVHGKLHLRLCVAGVIGLTVWTWAFRYGWAALSPLAGGSVGLFAAAVTLGKESRTLEDLTDQLLAMAFGAWGVIWIGASLAKGLSSSALAMTTLVPCAAVATLSVVAVNERDKRDTQRNMLALSNINLATSTFVGGAIQRMLSVALERVLGLAELPVGVLLLETEPPAPVSVVARGIRDEFCGSLQKEGLDRYLIELVARGGGLMGFRDLRNAESIATLEREEQILRFRELALAYGLRSVMAISLQAKEQAFGVLLLGTPDSRRFAPAEYRLLFALGHQIGMAVENSYLVQQTSRRSEELHVLNEIGRVLSSTLNKEDLLRKVWGELRRLIDVENFYPTFPF